MGDADTEALPSGDEEIKEWTGDLLDNIEQDSESLVDLMERQHSYTNQYSAQLTDVEEFQRCFTALNFLIVPIVIAIFLCYGSRESMISNKPNYYNEGGLQTIVSFLMYFSGFIGLPFYLYSVWKYYGQEEQVDKEQNKFRDFPETQYDSRMLDFLPSDLDHYFYSARYREHNRAETEQDLTSEELYEETSINKITSPIFSEDATSLMEDTLAKPDLARVKDNEHQPEVQFPVLYEFQIRMREESPDLEINIERPHDKNEIIHLVKNRLDTEQKDQHISVGNILEL